MSDNIYSYDQTPYESHPFPQSNPLHLKTIGTLFGMKPPALETARVLELGCAAGGNLIPFAAMHPKSHCVGVDLSNVQIKQGQDLINKLELSNIELKAMSITDITSDMGKFDYIITHGVFSWVPDFVREKMLEICGTMLSDNGISYISYNTLPGWNMVRSIRDMMLYHASSFSDAKDKVSQGRLLLQFLKDSTEGQNTPYAEFLKNESDLLANQGDYYIIHEHLEDTNFQIYFHDFMNHAAKYQLQYLGDASLASMYVGNLPPKASEKLAEIKDIVRIEQYMDYITNRRFRSSLLCKNNVPLNRNLNFNDIEKFYLNMNVHAEKAEKDVKLEDSLDTLKFFLNGNKDINISTSSPYMKAVLYALSEHSTTMLKSDELLKLAAKKLKSAKPDELKADFINNAMKLVLSGYLNISTEASQAFTKISEKPMVSKLIRAQCEHTPNLWVTNLKHERIGINIFEKVALRYFDGKNDFKKIIDHLLDHIKKGELTASKNNAKIEDMEEIKSELAVVLEQLKLKLLYNSLLIG